MDFSFERFRTDIFPVDPSGTFCALRHSSVIPCVVKFLPEYRMDLMILERLMLAEGEAMLNMMICARTRMHRRLQPDLLLVLHLKSYVENLVGIKSENCAKQILKTLEKESVPEAIADYCILLHHITASPLGPGHGRMLFIRIRPPLLYTSRIKRISAWRHLELSRWHRC